MGISAADLAELKKGWDAQGDQGANGDTLLCLLLETHKEYRDLFKDFKGKDSAAIKSSARPVSSRIMAKMGEFITSGDKAAIQAFVAQHKGFGIGAEHFGNMKALMGQYVTKTGQDAKMVKYYQALLDTIIESC